MNVPATLLPERGMIVANGKFALLTGHETVLFGRLIEVFPRMLSKEAIMEWIYQVNPDKEPEIKIVDVYICKIRKKIEPLGLQIDTLWGKGYALSPKTKIDVKSEAA